MIALGTEVGCNNFIVSEEMAFEQKPKVKPV